MALPHPGNLGCLRVVVGLAHLGGDRALGSRRGIRVGDVAGDQGGEDEGQDPGGGVRPSPTTSEEPDDLGFCPYDQPEIGQMCPYCTGEACGACDVKGYPAYPPGCQHDSIDRHPEAAA